MNALYKIHAKSKAFRAQLREVRIIDFFIYRLEKLNENTTSKNVSSPLCSG
jgi:hypothetical protein